MKTQKEHYTINPERTFNGKKYYATDGRVAGFLTKKEATETANSRREYGQLARVVVDKVYRVYWRVPSRTSSTGRRAR